MNKLSGQTLILLIVYVVIAAGLTILVVRKQSRLAEPSKLEFEESREPSGKLQPNELLFLDRNYPNGDVRPGLFQERLSNAIAFDKQNKPSNRGLDFPWTLQGPGNIGGRVNAIAVHPVDLNSNDHA